MAPTSPLAVLLLPLLLLSGCDAQQSFRTIGDACTTPDNKSGVCRLIRDCPALYNLLEGRPTQDNIIYLNRARCGFSGSDPILCCPGAAPPPRPPRPVTPTPRPGTPTPGPTPRPPSRPSPQPSDNGDGPLDVSNHPNLRLLPQATCSVGVFDRVVGGQEADIYAYPFIARLGYWTRRNSVGGELSYRCGGSLINSNYVLTAAHCVTNLPGSLRLGGVRLGEHTVGSNKDCAKDFSVVPPRLKLDSCLPPVLDFEVEETIVHPAYSSREMANDIALVRLRGHVNFQREEYVRPACLPVGAENQNMLLDKMKLTVAGWGTTENGTGSEVLLDVTVPVVSLDRCRNAYATLGTQVRITERQLCAGGLKGRDSCTGDSGGPLMFAAEVNGEQKGVQFGIVSFGPRNCGTGGVPGIYTRVGHYMDWILNSMRP